MRNIFLIIVVAIATILVIASVVPLIGLIIALSIIYYGVRRFLLTESVGGKVGWAVVFLVGLSMALSNVPALIGCVAFLFLYYVYRDYKQSGKASEQDDWILE